MCLMHESPPQQHLWVGLVSRRRSKSVIGLHRSPNFTNIAKLCSNTFTKETRGNFREKGFVSRYLWVVKQIKISVILWITAEATRSGSHNFVIAVIRFFYFQIYCGTQRCQAFVWVKVSEVTALGSARRWKCNAILLTQPLHCYVTAVARSLWFRECQVKSDVAI